MPTTAKVIAHSINEQGQEIYTLVAEYPRMIHSEVMTHRMFSRNASSSRAIPVEKQIERIEKDWYYPTDFRVNQKGMQGEFDLTDYDYKHSIRLWNAAKDNAIQSARSMLEYHGHKQTLNRLLEPFSHIQVIITATEWDNFFLQRLDKNAQPEIQELARVMKEAMDNSTPKLLKAGEWHLPFIDSYTSHQVAKYYEGEINPIENIWVKLSVARCARVSYGLNERGWGDIEKDLALYELLLTNNHWSPFEHQATPISEKISMKIFGADRYDLLENNGSTHVDRKGQIWSGNFKGWIQGRQLLQQTIDSSR